MNYITLLNKKVDLKDYQFLDKFIHVEQDYHLKHWSPIYDHESNVSMCILGKPAIEVDEWNNYNEGDSGYITNLLIQKYSKIDLKTFCLELNGAFSILILDHNQNKIILITDKVGLYPVYGNLVDNLQSLQLSTHPDILANMINDRSLDIISVAEFLKSGTINFPNTYYKEIKVFENSSYFIWDYNLNTYNSTKYFEFIPTPVYDKQLLVNELSASLLSSIKKRTTKYYGSKAVFLSAGADSRTVLHNALDKTDAITLYNVENTELKTTKEITKTLNVKHHLLKRDLDHYINVLEKSVLGTGGISEITSEHYLYFQDNEVIKSYDLLLTGCYFDYMFKGLSLNTKNPEFLGKKLPYKLLDNFNKDYYVPSSVIDSDINKQVEERENNIFSDYKDLIDLESKRIFPLYREYDSVMRLTLARYFDWDLISSDNDLIKIFLKMPVEYKLNNLVFDKAVYNITKKLKDIEHPEKKSTIGTHPYFIVLRWLIRKIVDKFSSSKSEKIYGEGSWINFEIYAKESKEVDKLWNKIENEERDLIRSILGYDAWKKGKMFILNQDGGYHLFFRIITFSKWHELYRLNKLLKK